MARFLGLDVGAKRLGVALSDSEGRIATPLAVLDVVGLKTDPSPLVRLIDEWDIATIVVGLPKSLDGSEGLQAQEVRAITETLVGGLGVDVIYSDERLSSVEASRSLRSAGISEKQARGTVDMIAASLILQTYLDRMKKDG